MGTFLGADTTELRSAAVKLREGATLCQDTDSAVIGQLDLLPWLGADRGRFRDGWQQVHGPALRECAARMEEFARRLDLNADEQDQASAEQGAAVGGGAVGAAGGAAAENFSPAPGDPTTTPATGEHQPYPNSVDTGDAAFDPNNLQQGQIGDCWLISGVGAVGQRDPQWIRDHMVRNADGSYTVTLFEHGKPVPVTVSSDFVEHGEKGADGKPSWVSVYEKAIAQHRGGYAETDGTIGSVWERVTGHDDDVDGGFGSESMELVTGRKADFDYFASFDKIDRDLANGNAVTVGTKQPILGGWLGSGPADSHVVGGHEYVVDRIETRNGVRQMHIVNPWGGGRDLWLTKEQFDANIQNSSSIAMPRPTGRGK